MATISSARATYGLTASSTPAGVYRTGAITLGVSTASASLSTADIAWCARGVLVGSGDVLAVNLTTGSSAGSTSYTAGTAQVETATAAGTISGSGNATVVVTAAGMTGTPKTISVAVINGDTAATWAGKVRVALAADTAVSALFDVSGSSTAIVLTRKATGTISLQGTTYNRYAANDATLNISLDNGTCTGITTAATSTNTTAGVLTSGTLTANFLTDLEGGSLSTIVTKRALLLENLGTANVTVAGGGTDSFTLADDSFILLSGDSPITIDDALTITSAGYADVRITMVGVSS